MKRTELIVGIMAAVLVVIGAWMLLLQPQRTEIAETRELQASVVEQQQQVQLEIARLQQVRAEAPEAEARLAAAGAVIPDSAALPSLLRQLQLAADESGLTLVSVTVGRPPEQVDAAVLAVELPVSLAIEGGYYQIVDFLRRVEDPGITPRAVLWNSMSLASDLESYPALTATLIGRTFANATMVPPAPSAEPLEGEQADAADDGDVEGDDDAADAADPDADPDVEMEQ